MAASRAAKKKAVPSLTQAEYLSDIAQSSEFYQTSFPIVKKIDRGRTGYTSFSADDAKRNKVKNFCTSANILQIEGYITIIDRLPKSIDIDHACEAIYIYNLISETLPPIESFSYDRVTDAILEAFRVQVVENMAKLKGNQTTKNIEKLSPKGTAAEIEIRKKRDIASMAMYVLLIHSKMDMSSS